MFRTEQRRAAIETFVKYGHSYADTIAGFGYSNRATLRLWWREHESTGVIPEGKGTRRSKYGDGRMRAAVDHCLEHGGSLSRTMRALGCPRGRQTLCDRVDELAPGGRKQRGPNPKAGPVPMGRRVRVVSGLEAGTGAAAEVAERHGVSRTAPYAWRREVMGHGGGDEKPRGKGLPAGKAYDALSDDVEVPQDMPRRTKTRPGQVQLELDLRQATLEIIKKDPGTDPKRLTNQEKSELADALGARRAPRETLPVVGMAKSSREYARNARAKGEGEGRARAREAVAEAFEASGGTYGHGRVRAQANAPTEDGATIGERTARDIMREGGLAERVAKRRRCHGSCEGEISEAPENLLRDDRGRHRFRADGPNGPWITDAAEFRIPAGKARLSPTVGCFGGMPPGWSISTSPDAEMANSSLPGACERLGEGDHPKIHSDHAAEIAKPHSITLSLVGTLKTPSFAA